MCLGVLGQVIAPRLKGVGQVVFKVFFKHFQQQVALEVKVLALISRVVGEDLHQGLHKGTIPVELDNLVERRLQTHICFD